MVLSLQVYFQIFTKVKLTLGRKYVADLDSK